MNQLVLEYLSLTLGVLQRRWKLIAAPLVTSLLIAALMLKLAPTTYVAKALILTNSANQQSTGTAAPSRQVAVEQVAALESWLKSDAVTADMLPRILKDQIGTSPAQVAQQIRLFKQSLALELIGNSALEVRLESKDPRGLGGKLEVVVSRLMEGLTGPEQSIQNAEQFVLARKGEAASVEWGKLSQLIARGRVGPDERVMGLLQQLAEADQRLAREADRVNATPTGPQRDAVMVAYTDATRAVQNLRASISPDASIVAQLQSQFAAYATARQGADAVRAQLRPGQSNFMGIFSTPENLLLVGRPQDPLIGESSGRKLAAAVVLLALLLSAGLLLAVEAFDGRLRTEAQFSAATGLPVLGRICMPAASQHPSVA